MFSALTSPASALSDNNEADWITAAVSSPDQNELFHLLFADWSEAKREPAVQKKILSLRFNKS